MPVIRVDKEKKEGKKPINPVLREKAENEKRKQDIIKKQKKEKRLFTILYIVGALIFFGLALVIICAINYAQTGIFGF